MGRSFTEPEVKLLPDHVSTYYISRTRDPDDEFACEQAMARDWRFRDIPEGVTIDGPLALGTNSTLDGFLVIDTRYAAAMALEGWKAGRESVEVHYS